MTRPVKSAMLKVTKKGTGLKKESIFSKIAWLFTKRYRVTLLFWVIILCTGLFTYTSILKREGFPTVNLPFVAVQGTYFADDAKTVDQQAVQPIATAIESVDSVKEYQTSATNNFFTVFAEMSEKTDVDQGTRDIEAAINDAGELPNGTEYTVSAIEPAKFDNKYNLLLAVYGEQDSDYRDLAAKAQAAATSLVAESAIENSEAIPVVETVTDPKTGQQVQRQTSINKVGIREGGEIVYYPAVSIGITKADNVDDIELSEAVKGVIEELGGQAEFSGTNFTITADFASTIDEQIASLQSSLLAGLTAVLIVALLLISWRAALVIALFIPTVMAASFLGLELLGYTLNTITLFALILTLGLFVDDATIIVEAIDAHRKDKKDKQAIIKTAVRRVGLASLAGTLTTVLVFSPMLYVSGILGEFIRLLPITVILSLLLSFVISIVLVPFLSRPLVLSGKNRAWLDKLSLLLPLEKRISAFLATLPLINKTNKKRGRLITTLMVGLSLIAIVAAGFFSGQLKLDIFPESKDSNVLQAQVEFPPNTPVEQAESITDSLDNQLPQILGEHLDYITYVSADNQAATLEIGLIPYTERDVSSQDFLTQLTEQVEISGASVKFSQRDAGPPSEDYPFQMRIYAQSDNTLENASQDVQKFLQGRTISTNTGDTSVSEVKIQGLETVNRSEQGRFVTVLVRYDDEEAASGAIIATEDVIKANYDETALRELGLSQDAFDFDVSQESDNEDSFNSIGIGLVIALIMMYLLLVILFNSYSQPLLIFMAIPFSLFGVFFGLWATDNAFSFFTMLGLLGLIGIVVNNSILLTEYANQERAGGADRHNAISRAVKDRFRPLVTTTLTTIFALLPLALSDPFWQPLAFTLIFGMASSTTLIILAFPYYYLFFERIRDWKNRRFPGLM